MNAWLEQLCWSRILNYSKKKRWFWSNEYNESANERVTYGHTQLHDVKRWHEMFGYVLTNITQSSSEVRIFSQKIDWKIGINGTRELKVKRAKNLFRVISTISRCKQPTDEMHRWRTPRLPGDERDIPWPHSLSPSKRLKSPGISKHSFRMRKFLNNRKTRILF